MRVNCNTDTNPLLAYINQLETNPKEEQRKNKKLCPDEQAKVQTVRKPQIYEKDCKHIHRCC